MAEPGTIVSPVEGQNLQTCCHHWVIESAVGPVSSGICQTCGDCREFENYVAGSTWRDDDPLKGYGVGSSKRMAGLIDDDQTNDGEEG